MTQNTFTASDRALPLGNYPHVRRVGDFIFVSGTSSRQADNSHRGATRTKTGDWELDISEQTHGTLQNIAALLASCEASLVDIVDVTTFLVSMSDFAGYNEVYGTYFTKDGPTRTTVAVAELPHPNLRIEIKVIAYKPLN